jgi:glutathione peroxidase
MRSVMLAAVLLGAGGGIVGMSAGAAAEAPAKEEQKVAEALNFKMKDIDGQEVDLSRYQGKVILMVNVASHCGNTPQYDGLERMYKTYKDKGLVIMGFPANNFKAQEPGTDAEIKDFCTSKYHVTFPMFAKISVKGEDIAPLYKYLTALDTKPQPKGNITWNFEKFLIGKDGSVIARFAPGTKPEDQAVVAAVEAALK